MTSTHISRPFTEQGPANGSANSIDQQQPVSAGTAAKTPRSSRRGDKNVGAHVERTLVSINKSSRGAQGCEKCEAQGAASETLGPRMVCSGARGETGDLSGQVGRHKKIG